MRFLVQADLLGLIEGVYATGLPPAMYIQFVRLQKAKSLLEARRVNVTEAAYEVGFKNPSHFTRAFYNQFGLPPSSLKKKP